MSDSDAVALLTDIADVAATYASIWISITFAYLTAAYFIGAKMSRFQCAALSGLYFVTAFLFGAAAIGHSHAFFLTLNANETIYSHVWVFSGKPTLWLSTGAGFVTTGTLVSLYFMYNVRKTKLPNNN